MAHGVIRQSVILVLAAGILQATSIPTIAGALSIAASSGTIIREGHDLLTHFKRTMKKHGTDLKLAFKGNPVQPVIPIDPNASSGAAGIAGPTGNK